MATPIVQPVSKPFFNRTTPAKLARSAAGMWFLLAMAALVTLFAWYEPHMRIQSLRQQSTEFSLSSSLVTDFHMLEGAVDIEALSNWYQATERARSDYAIYRDDAARDLEAAARADSGGNLLSFGFDKPELSLRLTNLRQGFASFQDDVTAARKMTSAGNEDVAAKQFQAAHAQASQLLGDANDFNLATTKGVAQEYLSYREWHPHLRIALLAMVVIMSAFISWQYSFMVRRGKAGSPLSTILCLILCLGVFSYAYMSTTLLDKKMESSLATFQSSLQTKAKPAALPLAQMSSINWQSLADGFDRDMYKADSRIKYIPASLLALLIAGLLYQVAVLRSIGDYRR
jgi:hypothetical protein